MCESLAVYSVQYVYERGLFSGGAEDADAKRMAYVAVAVHGEGAVPYGALVSWRPRCV